MKRLRQWYLRKYQQPSAVTMEMWVQDGGWRHLVIEQGWIRSHTSQEWVPVVSSVRLDTEYLDMAKLASFDKRLSDDVVIQHYELMRDQ